jgi:hypothetical protein
VASLENLKNTRKKKNSYRCFEKTTLGALLFFFFCNVKAIPEDSKFVQEQTMEDAAYTAGKVLSFHHFVHAGATLESFRAIVHVTARSMQAFEEKKRPRHYSSNDDVH